MKVMGCEAPQVWWIGRFPKSGPRVFKNLDWGSMQSQVGKLSELKSFVNCLSCSVKWRKKFSISLYKIPECPRCFFNSISFSYFVSGDGEGEGKWPNQSVVNRSSAVMRLLTRGAFYLVFYLVSIVWAIVRAKHRGPHGHLHRPQALSKIWKPAS